MLQTNMMSLYRQCSSNGVKFTKRDPCTRRPVIKAFGLTTQTSLKQVGILAQIMKKTGQSGFAAPSSSPSKSGCKTCNFDQMLFRRMCLSMIVLAMGKVTHFSPPPFDHILSQGLIGPDTEVGCLDRIYPVSHGNSGVHIEKFHVSGDLPAALGLNCFNF